MRHSHHELLTHQTISPGTIQPTGSHFHMKRQCNVTPCHSRMSMTDVNHYYDYSTTAYPPLNTHSFSLLHLHVISMLPSHYSWLLVYFITSSWPRFFFFLLMSIILLVIPLPDLDDTDNHQNMNLTTIGLMKHANITHGNILYILTPHYRFLVTNNTSNTPEHHHMSLSLLKNLNNDLNMYQKLMINGHMNMTTIGI